MAVLQMQRMSICALKKDRKAILEKIQSMGVMEINHVLDEDEDFRRMDTANARSSFEKAANSADRALEILNEYAPVKTSMLSSLEGKKLVDAKVHEEVILKREELLKVVSQIQALDKEKADILDHDKYTYPFWELGWKTNSMIHPILYTKRDWEKRKGDNFYENIQNEGIVIC